MNCFKILYSLVLCALCLVTWEIQIWIQDPSLKWPLTKNSEHKYYGGLIQKGKDRLTTDSISEYICKCIWEGSPTTPSFSRMFQPRPRKIVLNVLFSNPLQGLRHFEPACYHVLPFHLHGWNCSSVCALTLLLPAHIRPLLLHKLQ